MSIPRGARPTDPALLMVSITPDGAAHLLVAVQEHVKRFSRMGMRVPPELPLMVRSLAIRSTEGQGGSRVGELEDICQAADVSPKLLTYDDTARVLRASPSTVKRLVRAKELSAVKVLGSPRIAAADLDAYLERIAAEATTEPEGA